MRIAARRRSATAPVASLILLAALGGCGEIERPRLAPLTEPTSNQAAEPRVSGGVEGSMVRPKDFEAHAAPAAPARPSEPQVTTAAGGDITFNFADTDIREVVRTILGMTLNVNYTIDPNVRGTATYETSAPMPKSAVLPLLETLLNQNGATVVEKAGIYRVTPLATGQMSNVAAPGSVGAGTQLVPLRFVSAANLAKILEPYVADGGKVAADPARNAMIVTGDQTVRSVLIDLIRAFDIDILANQSYALFPIGDADLRTVATELEKVFKAEGEGPLANVVQVVPMARVNAVLVVSSQPRYLDAARRFFQLTHRVEDATARTWHVYYVQNGQSADLEALLQRAFTPGHVNPTPAPPGSTAPGTSQTSLLGRAGQGGGAGGTSSGGGLGSGSQSSMGQTQGATGSAGGGLFAAAGGNQPAGAPGGRQAGNPAAESLSTAGPGEGAEATNHIRIIANRRNNALLVYATPSEYSVIEGMLRKIDIIPLQVLIEATIAEVTLNDALQYGTQFYLRVNKYIGELSGASSATFASNFPGFVFSRGAGLAISALSNVTQVRVLSSPQVMVLDNEPAKLEVGSLVPILTGSAQSTLTSGAPIVNNIDYRETGVIMQVTPHVNSGGLVTLDLGQEVSDVASQTTEGINSPTFDERLITTRVAVQDGQTIGMAGLIRDTVQENNSGLPWLKDVPVLSLLASTQNNTRTRTELLIMLTPHVVKDQRDARALTEDLRRQLVNSAVVPQQLDSKPPSGSANPLHY